MDTLWQPSFGLNETDDYYYKPFLAAKKDRGLDAADFGYWSRPFYLNGQENENDSTQIITYSPSPAFMGTEPRSGFWGWKFPLTIYGNGCRRTNFRRITAAGICWPSAPPPRRTARPIPASPLRKTAPCSCSSRKPALRLFGQQRPYRRLYRRFARQRRPGHRRPDRHAEASLQYPHAVRRRPVGADRPALSPGSADASLKLQRTILLSLGISLVLGIASILLAAKIITKPVTNLAQKLRESNPNRVIRLKRLGITEIDELSDAIELLSPKGVRLRFPPVQDTGTHRRGCGSLRI